MASAIAGSSVATTTLPMAASTARRQTWTIIGSPAISAIGLPGRRLAAMRAGTRTITLAILSPVTVELFKRWQKVLTNRAYTGCFRGGKACSFRRGTASSGAVMDSFEFNKVAGGVLGTALLVMALSIGSEIVFEQHAPEKPGYVINVPKEGEGGGNQPPPVIEPIAVRLAKADPKAGANTAKACAACHTLEKGPPAKIGPNLYHVGGGPDAHMAGFGYSEALLKRKAEGKTWTFDELDHFLTDPKGY